VNHSELEAVVAVEDIGDLVPGQSEIDRTGHRGRRVHHRDQLLLVRRRQHPHAGHGAHDRQVLDVLVSPSGVAGEQAGVAGGDLYVGARLGYQHADLVRRPMGQEHGE
jgi:hypothetical protein